MRSPPGRCARWPAAGIADARLMFNYQRLHAPLRRSVSTEDIGGSALYLLSDLSAGVTGETHYVDAGYNIISMPRPEVLKVQDEAGAMGK
jgi:enoyl-[acyl-carrier protein] reductase I